MQPTFLYLASADAQLSLGLGGETPTERLFFAVMADAATAENAAQIGDALLRDGQVDGKPLARERLHVTLHHLGDYAGGLPPSLIQGASQAAARVALPAFEAEFDRVGTFGGRRSQLPCVLRGEEQVRGLYVLQGELGRQLAHVGIAGDAQYTPHMTLLYCRQALPLRRCAPLRWTVREFALVRSFLGQSRYQFEGRWMLR
ncbi:2'-5' RNA ligase family protein [Xanthomonas maliensis]|uniref:2'-5' RNA ligase family protein n=1 Tax=Xanthomonas maliensis TaxID=1321368 RepID=UPI0003B322B6|nr:2'-5' RNA ligase family protein [Xanthomonas maliensis]KAB7763831.1 RNA 2',3'-cyclic phosphodiesterase [Xanthomonas maliensis]